MKIYMKILLIHFIYLIFLCTQSFANEYYHNKTIKFIVGYSAGGGYDTYTRLIARHISKFIPGNPNTIVENMPGAGSLKCANYLYNKVKSDGLTIGVWNSAMVLQEALDSKGIFFKSKDFGWIGAPVKGMPCCSIMSSSGYKTINDILDSKEPIKMGAQRAGSSTDEIPKILNKLIGTNFHVISGYKGTPQIGMAMQSGEVDGACWGWESMKVTVDYLLKSEENKLIPFIIHGGKNDPEVNKLPQISNFITDQEKLTIFNTWVSVYEFQRPLTLPPGTPTNYVNILRKALDKTLHDEDFLTEARKINLEIEYVSGENIEFFVNKILNISDSTKKSLEFLSKK